MLEKFRIKLNLFLLDMYGVKGLINSRNFVGIYSSTAGHIVDTSNNITHGPCGRISEDSGMKLTHILYENSVILARLKFQNFDEIDTVYDNRESPPSVRIWFTGIIHSRSFLCARP